MSPNSTRHGPIAIIGLGCRYPDARNPKELWENVLARRQSFRRIPDERLPISEYGDPDKKAADKTYGTRAAVIDGFEFDWARRRIPKQVVEQTDIAHWLALDVALQALHDSGYEPGELPRDRTGVIVGNTLTGEQQRAHLLRGRWPFVQKTIRAAGIKKGLDGATLEELVAETEQIYKSFFPAPNEDTLAGALANTIAGRICNYMDLRGGGYTVDGACASSLLSVATASNALCAGDIDVALAGGVDVSLDAFELVGFAKVGALSDSEMKVYDRAGNGFLPGEGCGFIVMKRLEDAERDRDYVYAILNGWGVSSDGKGGITAPTADGQALALRRAYDRAGYSAHQLDFVEGHGTGTAVGDPIELTGISNTIDSFGEAEPHQCGVTSFKSLVGHTKAAAGVGGLLKAIAAVNRRVVPPTAGCDNPHEVFTGEAKNLYPVRNGICHDASQTLTAGVSAMGFGGINSHVTLTSGGEPSIDLAPELDERALLASKQETELFVFAEASLDALSRRLNELLDVASRMSIGEMPDLALDLAKRINPRAPTRAAIVAHSPEDLHNRLETLIAATDKAPASEDSYTFSTPDHRTMLTTGASSPRIGFLFPGQGSQRLNMATVLVERFAWARELVENADAWLQEVGVAPVSPFVFRDTQRDVDGAQQNEWMRALTQTEVAQPAICLASLLWLRFLKRLDVKPVAVGGHSLGELTAFHAAGALDEKSVIQLAGIRGKLMGEVSVDGSMASLVCNPDEARLLLKRIDGYVVIANINSASQTVVSGDRAAIAATLELASKGGIRARELPVSAAFHSAHFEDTVKALRKTPVLRGTATPGNARLYSTMTGTVLEGDVHLASHFGEQVVRPVNFRAVARLATNECDVLVEVGPGAVLSGLSNETAGIDGTLCLPLESKAGRDRDLNTALGYLFTKGAEIDLAKLWDNRLIRPFKSAAELSFFVNPCEKPVLDADLEASIGADEAHRDRVEGLSHQESYIRELSPDRARARMGDAGQPGGSSRSPQVNARTAILDELHRQTGFPVDTLTDDLRLVDDLHLDSIKTVELVSDAADRLGISEAFEAAQFADVTLGELIERMELLKANAPRDGGKSAGGPVEAERLDEANIPWVASFALNWEEERLPRSTDVDLLVEGRILVLAPDANDEIVRKLVRDLAEKGCDVHTCEAAGESDQVAPFDHLVVVYPDAGAPSVIEELGQVVELLTRAARALPSTSVKNGRPSCAAWIRARGGDAKRNPHYDWSADSFAATVHLERRKLRVRSLEFAGANTQHARIADVLLQELADKQPFASARYDSDGRRFVGRPRLQERASYAPRTTSIGPNDVVLVTGGAKGITAQCALALARETRATMVLVGSSQAPDAGFRGPGPDEIRETLSKFEAEGLRCDYRQCNMAVRGDVERLVATVRKDFGSVDVIVHGAGLNRPRRVEEPSVSEVIEEIGPKLLGALHLFDALEETPPKIFVALTSVIGVIGMPHNAWYAFANESLDRSLGQFAARHPSVDVVSLAYSIWDEVGMGAKLGSIERLGKLGIEAIPVEDGVARFVELVTHDPGVREVIVTGSLGGVDTWRPEMPALPRAHRFIDQILTLEPGRELVCRTTLDLERDPYVRDHVYEGSHLLPAVFGLEAMAEAVAYVTGREELPFPVTIENVELDRPLIVHPDRGLQIEIRARVDESELEGGAGQHVHAEIRSKLTGFEQAHFAARFELGAATVPAIREGELETEALPIEPKKHLYGSIRFQDGSVLFQGPRFQRIDELYALDSKHCRFAATQGFAGKQENWLLGDPYFRDALLQSLQLCVVPDQCLPVRIDRWEIVDSTATQASKRLCEAVIEGKEDDTYIGTISSVSAEGSPIETLVGYRARMLVQRLDWPAAEELALRGAPPVTGLRSRDGADDARARVNAFQTWDGGIFYRDVPGYGHEGQTAFFSRFPLTAQDASSPSGSLNPSIYFRWAGKLRETGGINTDGVYQGLLAMLGSNDVMSATNECETRILKVPRRNDLIEGRYWMEYVNKGDAGNLFEWWRIPFPDGVPELLAWTRMRTSAVKAIRHGVIAATEWPDFLYRFLRDMGDDAIEPTKGPPLDLDLGACLFAKAPGPKPGVLLAEQTFSTSQEDANVVGNIYFANYAAWQGRVADRFFHSAAPHYFEDRGARGELHRPETSISQLRDAMPFDEIRVEMRLDDLYERGAHLSFNFLREGSEGLVKIAAGRNLVSWALIERGATPKLLDWPDELREAMLRQVDERRVVLKKYA